jgi:biotin-dependent carboxylase-like uncharacterized protein
MPALRVLRVGPGATVQDLGRRGWLHHGVPAGGPMVRGRALRANRALGNDDGAALIELPLHGARFVAEGALWVSVDGRPLCLDDGATLDVPANEAAVRYVAVAGGLDVPAALGARGTLLVAALGGHDGRALRVGDVLSVSASAPVSPRDLFVAPDVGTEVSVGVIAGPDVFPPGALPALYAGAFTATALRDRVGMRLGGNTLRPFARSADGASAPMVHGALELTPDGTLIALGPDHPTTGGYPVIAVVRDACLDALADLRPGASLRFTPGSGLPRPR